MPCISSVVFLLLPPAWLCCFRLQRKSAHFDCLANLSLHLWFLHMKENKNWHIFVKTLLTLKCMFAHWLHLSHWKTVHVGEGILLTSLSHSHKTRKALKQRDKGICQCNCNQPFLYCPEETKTQCLSEVAQRLLFLAGSVFSSNSVQASCSKELEVPLQTSRIWAWGSCTMMKLGLGSWNLGWRSASHLEWWNE